MSVFRSFYGVGLIFNFIVTAQTLFFLMQISELSVALCLFKEIEMKILKNVCSILTFFMVVFVALNVAFLICKFLFVIMFAVDCKCDRIFSGGNLER